VEEDTYSHSGESAVEVLRNNEVGQNIAK